MSGFLTRNLVFPQSRIKAIIFDCDGTLVDSEEAHLSSWKDAARDWGVELTDEDYLSYVGTPDIVLADFIAKKAKCDSPDQLLVRKRGYFSDYQRKGLPSIAGTIAFIHRLLKEKDRFGLKLAVASAAFKDEVLHHLRTLKLDNVFDLVLSGQDDLIEYTDPAGVNKPRPYIYLHAAKLLGVSPSECIVVEDSHTGVTAGADAGCLTIAVPNSYSKGQDFSKAHLIIETLSDVTVGQFLEIAAASHAALSIK